VGDLDALTDNKTFIWHWLPDSSHSGGIILGVDGEKFEILAREVGSYYMSMIYCRRMLMLPGSVLWFIG
jgi:hypothetical protein